MEVSILSSSGLPSDAYVSLGDSTQRVMRRLDVRKPYCFSQSPDEPGVLKVEVLAVAGVTRVVRQPGEGTYNIKIPARAGGEALEVALAVHRKGGAPLATKAEEVTPVSVAARKSAQSVEYQHYLDNHKLTEYLQAMVKGLLEAQPAEPYEWMAAQLSSKAASVAAAKPAKPPIAEVRRPPPTVGGACVICGPSGVGKSTLIKKLIAEFPNKFGFSVSHTTREPRAGERDGVDYHFVTRERMEQDIQAGRFIEHAEVHGNFYGTSIAAVQSVIQAGKVCLLDIDVQGAASVRQSSLHASATYVFFAPPTMEVLEQRLRGRGTETEERVQKRLAGSIKEMMIYESNLDAWHITLRWYNEDVEAAYLELRSFLQKQMPKDEAASAVCAGSRPMVVLNATTVGPSFYSMGVAPMLRFF